MICTEVTKQKEKRETNSNESARTQGTKHTEYRKNTEHTLIQASRQASKQTNTPQSQLVRKCENLIDKIKGAACMRDNTQQDDDNILCTYTSRKEIPDLIYLLLVNYHQTHFI